MGQRMKAPKLRQAVVPQFGVIQGGALDGWDYTLKAGRVEKTPKKDIAVLEVIAQPPCWPFPMQKRTRLTRKDFKYLAQIPPTSNEDHWVKPKPINVRRLMLNAIAAQGETT